MKESAFSISYLSVFFIMPCTYVCVFKVNDVFKLKREIGCNIFIYTVFIFIFVKNVYTWEIIK